MQRLKWGILAGMVSLFVAYLGLEVWRGPEVKLYRVTRADLTQSIVASGHMQNPNRIEVSAQITSTVDSVPVKEGEFVKKGQLLIGLNSHEAQAGLQVAKAAAKAAQHHLQQLQNVNEPVAALAQRGHRTPPQESTQGRQQGQRHPWEELPMLRAPSLRQRRTRRRRSEPRHHSERVGRFGREA